MEENDSVCLDELPLKPSSDLMAKILLNHPEIIDLVCKELFEAHPESTQMPTLYFLMVNCVMSSISLDEQVKIYRPVIIEVQSEVDVPFINRLMSYCSNVYSHYNSTPSCHSHQQKYRNC
jgi:hypothetical protein